MVSVPSRKQVVVVGNKPSEDFDGMLAAAHASYNPNETVSHFLDLQVELISESDVNTCQVDLNSLICFFLITILPFPFMAGDSHRSN